MHLPQVATEICTSNKIDTPIAKVTKLLSLVVSKELTPFHLTSLLTSISSVLISNPHHFQHLGGTIHFPKLSYKTVKPSKLGATPDSLRSLYNVGNTVGQSPNNTQAVRINIQLEYSFLSGCSIFRTILQSC